MPPNRHGHIRRGDIRERSHPPHFCIPQLADSSSIGFVFIFTNGNIFSAKFHDISEISKKSALEKDIDALEKKIGALKHLLKGGNSTTALEDILTYEGGDRATLQSLLDKLQEKENELLKQKTALISKAAVKRKGEMEHNYFPANCFCHHLHATPNLDVIYCNAQLPRNIPPFPNSYRSSSFI